MFRDGHCSQLDEHNNEVNTYLPRDKSRYNAPPDWLKTAMVPKVPSLQLAKTEVLTPYTYTFSRGSRIFLHTAFFARHYSLPPRQPSVFARLARWQLESIFKLKMARLVHKIRFQKMETPRALYDLVQLASTVHNNSTSYATNQNLHKLPFIFRDCVTNVTGR